MKSSAEYRAQARSLMKGRFWMIFLGLLVVGALVSAASATVIGALIVAGPLSVGLIIYLKQFYYGEKEELADIFKGFTVNTVNNIVAGILQGIFISLWSLLFFIPGIIKGYAYSMTSYILADHPEMEGYQAIKESEKMMSGHKWQLFCLEFSFIGWILLSCLTFGILTI